MFLSDTEIYEAIENGRIVVSPRISKKNIRPVGLRIRLSDTIFIPKVNMVIDSSKSIINLDDYFDKCIIADKYVIKSGGFILAYSYERLKTSNDIITILDGRSTLARIGITIHQTAFVIDNVHDDPRFIMLELKNMGMFDVILQPKQPIGMLLFSNLSRPIEQIAQGQYKNQNKKEIGGADPYQLRLFQDID